MAACIDVRRGHARARAEERYGISLSKAVRREILRKIHAKERLWFEQVSIDRRVFVVELEGVEMAGVYSRKTRDIVTILPPDARRLAAWRSTRGAV